MKNNIFEQETIERIIDRINNLSTDTKANWGKMNASQMLAHCNVIYEMHYEKIHPKPNFLKQLMFKLFVKNIVVSDKPYKKNNRTAPLMIIKDEKNFTNEKQRLIDYVVKIKELGKNYFDGSESFAFGKLNANEWNNLFYKHLDHHLNQFGV